MGRGRGRGKGSGGSTLSAPKCQLQELCRRYTTSTPSGQTIGQSHRDRRAQGSLDRDNVGVSVSVGIGQVRVVGLGPGPGLKEAGARVTGHSPRLYEASPHA